jgi:hypothetical protein
MSLRALGKDEERLRHRIARDPQILGLGSEIITIGQEVLQPSNGRLDLLLEDVATGTR